MNPFTRDETFPNPSCPCEAFDARRTGPGRPSVGSLAA